MLPRTRPIAPSLTWRHSLGPKLRQCFSPGASPTKPYYARHGGEPRRKASAAPRWAGLRTDAGAHRAGRKWRSAHTAANWRWAVATDEAAKRGGSHRGV